MKFLEYSPLIRIDAYLRNVNLGDSLLKGHLEAYSCKNAGLDKKHFQNLEHEVIDSLVSSPSNLSVSPVGPLSNSTCLVHPSNFEKEDFEIVKPKIEEHLLDTGKVWVSEFGEDSSLCSCIWDAIDEVITIKDCDVYSYKPASESDALMERGIIWSFAYFFYNRKLKRILCFCCQCLSKMAINEDSFEEIQSENEVDYLEFMDMD